MTILTLDGNSNHTGRYSKRYYTKSKYQDTASYRSIKTARIHLRSVHVVFCSEPADILYRQIAQCYNLLIKNTIKSQEVLLLTPGSHMQLSSLCPPTAVHTLWERLLPLLSPTPLPCGGVGNASLSNKHKQYSYLQGVGCPWSTYTCSQCFVTDYMGSIVIFYHSCYECTWCHGSLQDELNNSPTRTVQTAK